MRTYSRYVTSMRFPASHIPPCTDNTFNPTFVIKFDPTLDGVLTMSMLSKYQLIRIVRIGETKTYLAEESATHRTVYIHQIISEQAPPNEPDLTSLVSAFLHGAPTEESQHLLDMGEDENRICIITADAPQCLELRRWLQSSVGAETADPQAPTVQAPASFPAPPVAAPMEKAPAPVPPVIRDQPLSSPASGSKPPGEFTLMFFGKNALAEAAAAESAGRGESSGPLPPVQNPEPTREVAAARPDPAPRLPSIPPAPPDVPSNIEDQFAAGTKKRALIPVFGNPSQPVVSTSSSPLEKKPGEFTLMMQGLGPAKGAGPGLPFEEKSPPNPPFPPTVEPSKSGPGEFTMMFQSAPVLEAPPSPPDPPPPVVVPPAAPQRNGPGEFTLMFNTPPDLSPPPPPSAPPAPVPAPLPVVANAPSAAAYGTPAIPVAPVPMPAVPTSPPGQPSAPPPQAWQYQQPGSPPTSVAIPMTPAPPIPAAVLPPTAGSQSTPTGAPKKSALPLVLIISACSLIAAVALILFFALRH